MSKPLVSDELWELVEPLLPKEAPKPKGGRPRVPDRACLAGNIFVLKSGITWEMLPQEMGCGSGMTCWRRPRDWQADGVWERLHRALLDRLGEADLIDAVPPIKTPAGRRRTRPAKDHADKAYDIPRCRQSLRRRIKARIARKGVESEDRLGRHRWVVERTLAWLDRFRRLTVRYERRQDIHEALLSLGCSLICFTAVKRFC